MLFSFSLFSPILLPSFPLSSFSLALLYSKGVLNPKEAASLPKKILGLGRIRGSNRFKFHHRPLGLFRLALAVLSVTCSGKRSRGCSAMESLGPVHCGWQGAPYKIPGLLVRPLATPQGALPWRGTWLSSVQVPSCHSLQVAGPSRRTNLV